jgi:phospholipase/carboxylesterase
LPGRDDGGLGGPVAKPPMSSLALLVPLLGTLDRVEWVQRHLYPPLAPQLVEELAPRADLVAAPLRELETASWPDDLKFMRERLVDVGRRTLELIAAFVEASQPRHDPIELYRALRRFAPLQEALYPLAPIFEPVSRWFLEPSRRDDHELVARLRAGTLRDDGPKVGVRHGANERDTRGGFSLYVPETWDGQAAMPLIVALHGGSGHGRDFLWTWLREARARGMLLLSPTARGRTWSLMGGEDVDAPALREMVEFVAGQYPVDRARVLLTGMSDGATYTFFHGLQADTPFTHLAPACGILHPVPLAYGLVHARDRHIYLVHGELDWMFPVQTARMSRDALIAAGARVVYRELSDLSHTYPRDENPKILDWLTDDATRSRE